MELTNEIIYEVNEEVLHGAPYKFVLTSDCAARITLKNDYGLKSYTLCPTEEMVGRINQYISNHFNIMSVSWDSNRTTFWTH